MRRWFMVLGTLVVAAAGYCGFWFWSASIVRAGLPAWAAAEGAKGVAVTWRTAEIGGFPLSLRIALGEVTLQGTRPVPYAVQCRALVLLAAPWDLGHWRVTAPEGGRLAASAAGASLDAATLDGTVATTADGTEFDLQAMTVSGNGLAAGFAAERAALSVSLPAKPPAGEDDPMVGATLRLDAATIPGAPSPFSGRIDTLELGATVRGAIGDGPLEPALAAWRDRGGTVELETAHLVASGATIDASGTLALDQAMQPEGALTASIVGADSLVDGLVSSGSLKPDAAGFAKAVLRAIATPGPGGTHLRVPVTVQDQRVFVGPAPIAAVPHIAWAK